jgi:arginine/ornithine transport system permease protein
MDAFAKLIEYVPLMLDGFVVTLTVAFASLAIALVLGLITASVKLSGSRVGRAWRAPTRRSSAASRISC